MAEENDININIKGDASGIEGPSSQAKAAVKGVSNEAKELQAAFKRLQQAIDPTFAAQEKYNKALEDNRRLLAAGMVGAQEFAAANRVAAQALDQARTAAEKNSAAYKERVAAEKLAAAQAAAIEASKASAAKAADDARAASAKTAASQSRQAWEAYEASKGNASTASAAQVKAAWAQYDSERSAAAARVKLATDLEIKNYEAAQKQAAENAKIAAKEAATARETIESQVASMWKVKEKEQATASQAAADQAEAAWSNYEAQRKAESRATASQLKGEISDYERAQKQAADQAIASAKATETAKKKAASEQKKASSEAAKAATDQARAEKLLEQSLVEVRGQIDPLFAAQTRYNQTMQAATRLLMENKLQQGEFTQIQNQARQTMDLNTRSIGRQNIAYVNLGYQAQDVVASLASGINPMVILAQQGGQTASAIAMMGGETSKFASFMAGPWGAAIIAAVAVLGMLIPKLFEATNAQDAMKRSQESLKEYIDSTTGAIYDQITATQRLAAAKNEQTQADLQRETAKKGIRNILRTVQGATAPGSIITGDERGVIPIPAQVTNPRSVAEIDRLTAGLRNGTIASEEFARGLRRLGAVDPEVRKVARSITTLMASTQDADQAARRFDAQQRVYLGTATDEDRALLDKTKHTNEYSQSYLNAQATIRTSTDAVTVARARQTVAEEQADRVRKAAVARGGPRAEAAANEAYIATVGPFIAATAAAEKAKSDASKAASAARREARKEESEARKAAKDELQWQVETFDFQKQLADDDYETQVSIQNQKIEALRNFYGEQSREVVRAQRELESMEHRHQQQLLQQERDGISRRESIEEGHLQAQKDQAAGNLGSRDDLTNTLQSAGLISPSKALAAHQEMLEQQYQLEADYEDRIYQLKVKALNDQLALANLSKQQRMDIASQIEIATATHEDNLTRLVVQNNREITRQAQTEYLRVVAQWRDMASTIGQGLSQTFQGMWTHSQSFLQGMIHIADQIVYKFFDMGVKLLEDWMMKEAVKLGFIKTHEAVKNIITSSGEATRTGIAAAGETARQGLGAAGVAAHTVQQGVKTTAAVTGEALQTGAKVAGETTRQTVGTAGAITEITGRAATSAAGAFSSTVVIPFIGPVAAPIAAAVALAAVLGFASLLSAAGGIAEVPNDQLAMVHKKEAIIPAWLAEPMRQHYANPRARTSSIIGGAAMAGADARAATHGTINFKYAPAHTMGKDVSLDEMFRRDGRSFRKWVANELRNNRDIFK